MVFLGLKVLEVVEPEAEFEALVNEIGSFRREVVVIGEKKNDSDGGCEGWKEGE